jgi:hypothetical protein
MKGLSQSKYGYVALGLCLTELLVIWGGLGIVDEIGLWGRAPEWLADLDVLMYLAGLAALAVAIVGLVKDRQRLASALALLLGVFNLAVCAIPLANLR